LLVISIVHDYHVEKELTFKKKHISKKTSFIPSKGNSKPKLDEILWDYMVEPLNELQSLKLEHSHLYLKLEGGKINLKLVFIDIVN